MGVTMWVQMKLNPAPPDPTQQMIFNWMPMIFTFMLAKLPGRAGDLLGLEQHALGAAAERDHAHATAPRSSCSDNLKRTFFKPKPKQPAE